MPDAFGRPLPGEGGGVDAFGRPTAGPTLVAPSGGFLSSIPGAQTALSAIAPALDFLSRGQYASAGFFDALINDDASIGDALGQAWSELTAPVKRKSFSDVISRSNPDFARNNPTASKIIGFLGDVALDPTTYLGLGIGAATKGARIGTRALTTLGEAYQTAARGALAGREAVTGLAGYGRRAAEVVAREQLTRLPQEIAQGANIARLTRKQAGRLFEETTSGVASDIRTALGGRLPAGVTPESIEGLAQKISLERLGLPNAEAANRALTVIRRQTTATETLESADELINRVATLSPSLSREIFKPSGLKLNIGVPFTKAQASIPIINREMLRAVGLDKLEGLANTVAALPGIKQALNGAKMLRGAFDRFYQLDPQYIRAVTKLHDEYEFLKYDVVRDVKELAEGVTREGRDRISKVMSAFQAGVGELPEAERARLAPNIFRAALGQTPLQPKEQAITFSLLQGHARAAELEKALGVSAQLTANFDPRVYNAVAGSADEAADIVRRMGPDGADVAGLDAARLDKLKDVMAAAADGADVEKDALLLYAQRVIQARQRLPREQMKASLRGIFGTDDIEKIAQKSRRVANDLRYYGEYKLPVSGDEGASILGAADWLLRKWKGIKTVYNPSFAPRQAFSNSLQSALALGSGGYRAFDPRAYTTAARIVLGKAGRGRTGLADEARNFLNRFTEPEGLQLAEQEVTRNLDEAAKAADLSAGVELTLPTGQKITGEELNLIARQNGWIRGQSGYSGEFLKRSLRDEIGLGKPEAFTGKAGAAMKALADGYLGLAGHVEDVNRVALGINGLMMGYSPPLATEVINRSLFDYFRSFSKFEQEVMKRLVPFYSFNRLAVPFVLKETLENPAAPATLNKVAELIGTLVTPDQNGQPATLSPGQRELFGRNFLVDQPRIYKGFDSEGRAVFNVFNNLTPFDALSIFTVTKKDGATDWRRTAEKTVLGMLTPYLKIPAELAANREFFTGQVIDDARGYGGYGKLGKVKDTALDRALPEPIKAMMGWEWGQDRRTGEPVAYVNPYFAYTMGQMAPNVARLFVKPLGDSENQLERSMRILTGVSEQSVDFQRSLEMQNAEDKRTIADARQKIYAARRTVRPDSLEVALADYRKIIQAIGQRRAASALPQVGAETE